MQWVMQEWEEEIKGKMRRKIKREEKELHVCDAQNL